MRVAYVVSRYPAVSHTFIAREVRALRALGIAVRTFSVRPPDQADTLSPTDAQEIRSTTVVLDVGPTSTRVRRLLPALVRHCRPLAATVKFAWRVGNSPRSRLWQLFYLCEAVVVYQACLADDLRHVHAHFANNGSDVARLVAWLGNATPRTGAWTWSFTMHGPTEFSDVSRFGLVAKAMQADGVVCISDYARSQLMALTTPERWSSFVVVHCGLELEAATSVSTHLDWHSPLRILCVGRLVPEKGQAVLLEAVAQLRDRGLACELVFVGGGADQQALQEAADARGLAASVRFTGPVGHDQVEQWLGWADLFCLASFAEGVPVVLMEAMAAGLPVVATRIAGIPELVQDGVTGLLTSPGRSEEIFDAVLNLRSDGGLRARLAAAGQQHVYDNYDVHLEAAKLLPALREFATGAAKSADR